jgi:signal transduction histidine kinase/tetratricopeptide (TPR) repeat protein/DNA-binding response OmpR family regulator
MHLGQTIMMTRRSEQPELAALLRRADEARAGGNMATAAAAYAAAVALLPAAGAEAQAYELRLERAICLHQTGDYSAEEGELAQLEYLAEQLGTPDRQLVVSLRRADLQLIYGDRANARLLASRVLASAEQSGASELKAEGHFMLAQIAFQVGDHATATTHAERALALFRASGKRSGAGGVLRLLGLCILGKHPGVARAHIREALAISRACGDRNGEALALNALGVATSDYAEARTVYQQGLVIAEQIGNRVSEAMLTNNLGAIYVDLGLYRQAWRFTQRAVRLARDLDARDLLAACLETLGRACGGLGQTEQARTALREAYSLAEAIGSHATAAVALICLARSDLDEGDYAAAEAALERAAHLAAAQGAQAEQASALAWWAATRLMEGDYPAALTLSTKAVALIEDASHSSEFPSQEIWWQRFRVLSAAPAGGAASGNCLNPHPGLALEAQRSNSTAFLALRRAREAMYATIATLSDPGLRRSYLNRIEINRAIVETLARTDRVQRPQPARNGRCSLHDQLTRMLAISARLNELRDADALRERFLDELVELSGAERLLLVLGSNLELPEAVSGRGLSSAELEELHTTATPLLREALQRRRALLEQRSDGWMRTAIAIPLISGAHTVGALYGDVRDIFGPFTSGDLNLISLLAAQAATAFENARLYQQTVHDKEELEQQVAQRTADLQAANVALQRRAAEAQAAFAAAEAASAAKSAFLANVSHELRTPLNAVIGFAQVLERDKQLSLSQRDLVAIIARSGNHLLSLINDVIELARIESGRMRINPAPFDLHQLFYDIEKLLRLSAEQRRIGLRVVVEPDLPRYVVGDEGRLRQVLLNLVTNAIKFTQVGGVQVRAAAEPNDGRLRLRVSVVDTGMGIAPDELGLLFQPFVQTGSGRRTQEGTGLGLALSRQLARMMGGEISVNSVVGVGSSFVVEALLDPAAEPVSRTSEREVSGLVTAGRRYRALVISSVWHQRRLYGEWLRQAGLMVREADDERIALANCDQWHPHLVLLSIDDPSLEGFALLKQIKMSPNGRSMLVLALTMEADPALEAELRAAGCDDVLAGQTRYDQLLRCIAQQLGLDLIYRESTASIAEEALSTEDLVVLPENLRTRLAQAVALSDPALVEAAIVAVQAGWPELGARLAAMADEFQFEQIEQIIGKG